MSFSNTFGNYERSQEKVFFFFIFGLPLDDGEISATANPSGSSHHPAKPFSIDVIDRRSNNNECRTVDFLLQVLPSADPFWRKQKQFFFFKIHSHSKIISETKTMNCPIKKKTSPPIGCRLSTSKAKMPQR